MTEQEAKSLIEEIESLDFESKSGQEAFDEIIGNRVRAAAFTITINPHPDVFFVRARILKDKNDYFNTIDDHSYNKMFPQYIKRGRANFDKQPMFYAGRTRITSLAEVNIIQNKIDEEEIAYGVSRWAINKPLKLIAILNPDTISLMKKDTELDGFLEFVKNSYNELRESSHKGVIMFYKYLSDKFTERIVEGEEHKYIFTSTFANQIFNKLPDVAGILYQSVKRSEAYNIVIKPSYIDEEFLLPTHFLKQTFKRKNIIDLHEINVEQAVAFDKRTNTVKWNSL